MTSSEDFPTQHSRLSAAAKQALFQKWQRGELAGVTLDTQVIHRRSEHEPALLSFSQQRLWFLDQLIPNKPVYNVPSAIRLAGPLSIAVLQESLNEIVRRHESLRTTFVARDGEALQFIAPTLLLSLPIVDLQALPEIDRELEAQRLMSSFVQQPFDLAQGPLIRVKILRLAEDEHILLLLLHHIICDGWSLHLLLQELSVLYQAFLEQRPSPLPAPPIQYVDYALWQRRWLQGEVLESQLAYWRQQLQDAPTLLSLPTDRPRPPIQTFQGAYCSFQLSPSLTAALKALSQREEVTLFMTLLAAWQVLLSHYSGQDDIIVGTPVANRQRGETEGLIGFLASTLALRTHLSGDPGFRDLLRQVRETTLGAFTHQDIPFERLVEELHLDRNMSHNPLFQVMLNFTSHLSLDIRLPHLTTSFLPLNAQMAKFDLHLVIGETADGLRGSLEYNTDLFDAGTMQRMLGHYQTLLTSIVTDPHRRLSALPYLTPAEQQQLLVTWNATQMDYPHQRCLHQLFEAQVERTPEAIAVIFEEHHLSFHDLNRRANQLAHYLYSQGVAPETLVALCLPRSLDLLVAILAILKAGGAYVPLDPSYPSDRLAFLLHHAQVSLLLTQQHLLDHLPASTTHLLLLDTLWPSLTTLPDRNPASPSSSQHLAYVLYTSGSTGIPKGVAIEHHSCVSFLHWAAALFPAEQRQAVLAATSICFDLSIFELFVPLCWGGQLILASQALDLPSLPAAGRVSLLNTVPTVLRELLRLGGLSQGVRLINLAGEVLPHALVEQVYAQPGVQQILNLYGPTEATTYATAALIERGEQEEPGIGRPIANTQVYVLDQHLQSVPIGVVGELYIGGEGLARGYLHQPELSAERFVPHPWSQTGGQRLYRTGDLVRYRPDGTLAFVGRADTQVKLRGLRIELGEIETILASHPAVQQCCVVLHEEGPGNRKDRSGGSVARSGIVAELAPARSSLVAYVALQQSPAPTTSELRYFLQQQLPDYMLPASFVLLERLPLSPNGKVNRRALPAPDSGTLPSSSAYVAPRNPLEHLLAQLWQDVLGLERIGVHDNFFELGGHSLLATQVIARLRPLLEYEVALRLLFECPTIADLATHLLQHLARSGQLEQRLVQLTRSSSDRVLRSIPARSSSADAYDLSFAQQRLWFLEQLAPGGSSYHIPAALRLHGRLNLAALDHSLQQLVQRHEALRTTFHSHADRPVQAIAANLRLHLPLIDLSGLTAPAQREAEAQRLGDQAARQRFDLRTGPLLRVLLLRLGEQEHIFVLILHHIISDGWSLGVLLHELAMLYTSYATGQPSPLPALPIQYVDYALWQRHWLQGEVLQSQLAYWQQQLQGAPTVLALPTDHPRPPIQTFQGAYCSFQLSASLSQALQLLSQHEGVTLFMTLLAAWQLLLSHYSGQQDFIVGTPIANRTRPELEGLIGFFVNMLALRCDLTGDPSFHHFLQQIREVALDAYAHQDLPFEQLVEALQPARNLSYTPLFQVVFILQNVPMSALHLPELSSEPLALDSRGARMDLTFGLVEAEQGLHGLLEYNTDLFEASTIQRMLGHYQTLLASIVADPHQRLSDLAYLTPIEQQQLLVAWNATQMDYPRQRCLHELIEEQVERTPDAIAIVCEDEHLSYLDLNQRANQLAHYLYSQGVAPETRVAFCLPRSTDVLVAILAILKAGGAYVPLDPSYPSDRLAFLLQQAQVSVLLTHHHLLDHLPPHQAHLLCLDSFWSSPPTQTRNPAYPVSSQHLAYVIYTSGSTGRPKGVAVLHHAIVNLLTCMRLLLACSPTDILLSVGALSFDLTTLDLFLPLTSGARLVLATHDVIADGHRLALLLRSAAPTIMQATPSLWRLLLTADWPGDPHLTLITGGEPLPHALATQLCHCARRVWNLYGPTETTVWSTASRLHLHDDTVSIGRPIANTQLYVLDQHLQPVPIGIPGELYIGGEGLARGYLHQPELSAERFVPHPFSEAGGQRLYRTGDLVRYRPDGTLEFVGRVDTQIKLRGFRIELGEIETVLASHPAVQQCCVVLHEHSPLDQRLLAYLVTHQQPAPSPAELRHFLQQQLPDYMLPASFVLLERLPLSPNGKVNRRALPAPDPGTLPSSSAYLAPRNPLEHLLAQLWQDVLGLERIGIHDNFFELGGHSLLATQVIARLRRLLEHEVALRLLFERPTIADLATHLLQHLAQSGQLEQRLIQLTRSSSDRVLRSIPARSSSADAYDLSFAQQRLWFLEQLAPGGSSYHIPAALRLHGRLNLAALDHSLQQLVQRHEALRTTFHSHADRPVQAIAANLRLHLPLIDLSGLTAPAQREAEAQRLGDQAAQQRFDLSTGPLLRVLLLRLGEQEHIFVLILHHIISDGWSLGVLLGELTRLYQAFLEQQPSPLPALPIQYVDYALWQRHWLQGEVLQSQLAYWQQQLQGAPTVLALPTDHPRPPIQTFQGAYCPFQLSASLSHALQLLSQREGVTLFMTLLAAWQILLSHYSGQQDLIVGTPIANRTRPELEGLIGFFVNMLALRCDLAGDPSFHQFLQQVREVALDAYAHQDLPFEQLVEALQPARNLSYTPLFQVVFILQNVPMSALHLPELTSEPLALDSRGARMDLTFGLVEAEQGLHGLLEYNTDLFEASTIQRMLGHYQTLLTSIVADPHQRLSDLAYLTPIEQQQLLVAWNATRMDYPRQRCLHELIEEQVERTPDAIAVVCEDEHLSYLDLNQRANHLAHHLHALGVAPETRVAFCLPRSTDVLVAILAILKAGGAYVPLDPSYPSDRLAFLLQQAQVSVLLTHHHLLDHLPPHQAHLLCLDSFWSSPPTQTSNPAYPVSSQHLAYVIYTSGSTGRPKGVAVLHHAIVNLLTCMRSLLTCSPTDTLLSVGALSFDLTTLDLFLPLTSGARLVLATHDVIADGHRLALLLRSAAPTIMQATPSLWRLLLTADWPGDPHLTLITGGEPLPHALASQLCHCARRVWNLYGPTETTVWSTASRLHLHDETVSIGRPIANTQLYVLDQHLQPVPIGIPGELYIGGEGLARGYLHQPELSAERFVPHPFSQHGGARLYRTGDLVRYRPDGTLEFVGRVDTQIKLRGFRIELGEIETVLASHPAVQQCCVVLHEHSPLDQRLLAYLVTHQQPAPSPAELRHFLQQQLPDYMLPASFVLLERLPLSPNGKVNRRALPAPDPGRPELAAAYVAPRTKVEQIIAAIWKEALQLEKVGMHDNFFDLGGHSLLMAQVQKKLAGAFHTNVPLVDLFQYPNIDALARHMSQEGELPASSQDDEQSEKLKAGRSRLQQRLTQRQQAAKEGRI